MIDGLVPMQRDPHREACIVLDLAMPDTPRALVLEEREELTKLHEFLALAHQTAFNAMCAYMLAAAEVQVARKIYQNPSSIGEAA